MDISMFSAISGGLQQAYGTAKGLLDLKVSAEVTLKVSAIISQLGELSGKLMEAQLAHVACQQRAMDLEKEVADLKAFEAQKERYELKELAAGAFAYSVRPALQGEEPAHHLCCHCFLKGVKSILQSQGYKDHSNWLKCPACAAEISLRVPSAGVTVAAVRSRRSMLDNY